MISNRLVTLLFKYEYVSKLNCNFVNLIKSPCNSLLQKVYFTTNTINNKSSNINIKSALNPPRIYSGNKFRPNEIKYIDKTLLIGKLLFDMKYPKYVFLPIINKFGKTYTLDVMNNMARGNKDLFNDTEINKPSSEIDLSTKLFTVLSLSFNYIPGILPKDIYQGLKDYLYSHAKINYDIDFSKIENPPKTIELILEAYVMQLRSKYPDRKIILLLDDYDSLILKLIPNRIEYAQKVIDLLIPFYEQIKVLEDNFHKVIITGQSTAAIGSLYNALLSPPSIESNGSYLPLLEQFPEFTSLFGFTEDEVRNSYSDYINSRPDLFGKEADKVISNMKIYYGGYRFNSLQPDNKLLLNPWDVICFLETGNFQEYWVNALNASLISSIGLDIMRLIGGFDVNFQIIRSAPRKIKDYIKNWQLISKELGLTTIIQGDQKSNDLKIELAPPNEEVREWLSTDAESKIYPVNLYTEIKSYHLLLLECDFEDALNHLSEACVISKTADENLLNFALHSLKLSAGVFEVYTEGYVARHEEFKRPLGIVIFKKDSRNILVLYESTYNQSCDTAIQNLIKGEYVESAIKYFYKSRDLLIDTNDIHLIGMNISTAQQNDRNYNFVSLKHVAYNELSKTLTNN